MTREQFDSQKWRKGMRARYGLLTYDVVSVDFGEYTLLLWDANGRGEWVKCEDVEIL